MMNHQSAEREAQWMQANREELVERIGRAIRADGTAQPLQGLHLYRHSFPLEQVYSVVEPSLCVVAQGSKEIHAHPPSPYKVRPATLDDVPALLTLHQRHYGSYPGSFDRTLQWQEHLWRHRFIFAEEPPVMVLTPDNEPRGYLIPFQRRTPAYHVLEVATDDWPASSERK